MWKRPVASSSAVTSVNVPPTSIPMRSMVNPSVRAGRTGSQWSRESERWSIGTSVRPVRSNSAAALAKTGASLKP